MRASAYFLLAFTGLLALLLAMPFTAPGTRLLLQVAERTGAVQVEYDSGRLLGDLKLAQLHLQAGEVEFNASGLHSSLDLSCFWTSRFCLETLRAKSVTLDIRAAAQEPAGAAESTSASQLQVPFAIEVPALQVAHITVRWPGGEWDQGGLNAAFKLVQDRVQIDGAVVERATLTLVPDAADQGSFAGFAPFDLSLPLTLDVSRLALHQLNIESGDTRYQLDALQLAATWQRDALSLRELSLSADHLGAFTASGAITFAEQWPMQWDVALTPDGDPAPILDNRPLQVSLQGDMQALRATASSAGLPAVQADASADVTSPGLPFSAGIELDWSASTRLGDVADVPAMMAEIQLSSPVKLDVSGTLAAQTVDVSGEFAGLGYESLQVSALASIALPLVELEQLQLTDAATDSRLSASGELMLEDAWTLVLRANSDGVFVPPLLSTRAGRLQGELVLQAQGQGERWRLQLPGVDIEGTVNGLPATIEGFAGVTSELALLPGSLKAQVNGANLTVDAAESGDSASFALKLDNLGRWLRGANGSLVMTGRGNPARQTLVIDGRARDVTLLDASIPAARFDLRYGGQLREIDMALRAPVMRRDGYQLRDVALTLRGDAQNHRLQWLSEGRIEGALQVNGSLSGNQWRGTLEATTLSTTAGDWTLAEAAGLSWDGAGSVLQVAPHCWQHVEFELCSDKLSAGPEGEASLRLTGDLRAFNGLLPRGVRSSGALDADLHAAWGASGLAQLDGSASLRAFTVHRLFGMGERASVTWDSADLDVRQEGESLTLEGDVVRAGRKVLQLTARLPQSAKQPMDGQLTLDALQLAAFSPWVTELSTLEGAVSGTLALSGTPSMPKAQGSLRLEEGTLVAVSNPTRLSSVNLQLQLDGTEATVAGTGLLGTGEVALQGRISVRPEVRLELAVKGARHRVLVPPSSELEVSEDLTLVLEGNQLDVRGDIQVHDGFIRHEELPEGSVGISRDVVQVDVQGNVLEQSGLFDVSADLRLEIDDRFRITGETVNATLGGELRLRQTPGQPLQVFGTLGLQGGELFVFRQFLQIKRGSIAFSGPADNPALDIAAERKIPGEGITVGAGLKGPLDAPRLEVYSDPVMSQGEAMSYLVRGRGLDVGAGADGTALALSLGADIVNRSGIVSGLNKLPLISNVAFGASGDEDDTAATVSGYIGNRIYVSYGIGLYEPINVLTARLYLQSRLWLEVMSRLENSIDLYYSFDIR